LKIIKATITAATSKVSFHDLFVPANAARSP